MKKRVLVTVSQASDGTYWCHTENDVYSGKLNSAGKTVKEAKDDLQVCLDDARVDFVENGGQEYEVEFMYSYDLCSFFEYFSFFNTTEIAKRAHINPSLMRQYTSGVKKAGEKTYSRLSACLEGITSDLQAASFRQ